jgi:hypothetical protein
MISGLSMGCRMILKEILKMTQTDLGLVDLEDGVKVIETVALALNTQNMLVKNGLIPANIISSE